MKWLKITVVFFLVTLVKCGPTRSEEDPGSETEAGQLTLKTIERNADDNLIFTLAGKTPDGTTYLLLQVTDGEVQGAFNSIDPPAPASSYTFKNELTKFSGNTVEFQISANDKDNNPLASLTINSFQYPIFPDKPTATRLDDPRNPGTDVISRVEGSLGTLKLDNAGTLITEKDKIHYYHEIANDYRPCTEINSVTICDVTIAPEDLTSRTSPDEILNSAVLSYGTDKAIVKLLPKAQLPDILDAILIPTSPKGNILCDKDDITGSECTISNYEPSEDTLQMVIVQKTTNATTKEETWSTTTIDIHDRKLVVNKLGTNIIEGRWKMLGDESFYRMELNGGDKTDVDCSHLTLQPKVCFGYFSGLTPGNEYNLTVAYKKDGEYNDKDQIELSKVSITLEPELAILSHHTTRHSNQLTADVNICFQHLTPPEGGAFSHYEMLIINEKGQWLKHRILEEEEGEEEEEVSEGRLCFAPFTINTKDFDLTEGTKVLISQRGVDGVTVLATGESKLL